MKKRQQKGKGIFSSLKNAVFKKPLTTLAAVTSLSKDPRVKSASAILGVTAGLTGLGKKQKGKGILNDAYRYVMNSQFSNPNDSRTIMRPGEYHGVNLKFDITRPFQLKSPIYLENSRNIGPGTDIVNRMTSQEHLSYDELTKGMTLAEKSSLLHDLLYLKSKSKQDVKNADQRMSGKLLDNISIFHPIDSINNAVYGGIIRGKQIIDNNLFDTTSKVTTFGEYDKLSQQQKYIIDKRINQLKQNGLGVKSKKNKK